MVVVVVGGGNGGKDREVGENTWSHILQVLSAIGTNRVQRGQDFSTTIGRRTSVGVDADDVEAVDDDELLLVGGRDDVDDDGNDDDGVVVDDDEEEEVVGRGR